MKKLIVALILVTACHLYANDWGEWSTLPSLSSDENTNSDTLPPSLVEALTDPDALRQWVLENPEWAQRWAQTIDLDLAPLIGQDAWDIVLNETLEQLNQQDNIIQPIQASQPQGPITIIPPGSNEGDN